MLVDEGGLGFTNCGAGKNFNITINIGICNTYTHNKGALQEIGYKILTK
jgi:hypothetical protein